MIDVHSYLEPPRPGLGGALVTGGSRGLGRALGGALARSGRKVVLVARHPEALAAAVTEIERQGGEAHGIVADVADGEAAPAIAAQAAALVGPIALLVNNASTLGPVPLRLLLDTDCDDLERVLRVNVVAPFRLIKAIGGAMVLRGEGTILDISSDAALEPYARWGAYGASKAALEQLGRIFAAELAGTGVRLWTIDPGEMNTAMHADAIPDADPATLADPVTVAHHLVALLDAATAPPSGARLRIQGDGRIEMEPRR